MLGLFPSTLDRGKALERGDWAAEAAAEAVRRTAAALLASSVSAAVLPNPSGR